MIYSFNETNINTNLTGRSYQNLKNGIWKIGYISDNHGLENENDDKFYQTKKFKNKDYRTFKNKVQVKLLDGTIVNKHIIHWVDSDNYFCVTNNNFWDQFD
jgi:hypothetical protein